VAKRAAALVVVEAKTLVFGEVMAKDFQLATRMF